ncbi:MAG: nicotinate (nicotinamide) nucleotide adenylyltransferase [Campylobacterota bacterium]|nr:nicotinate (nicotinamide) nucleotide adenylyltransferase [Campylobacterota bacterium]
MLNKTLTTALYGGSFDPPHIGHKAIVEALRKLDYIDKITIMPTFLNPFKISSHAPSELRFRWLKEIFKSFEDVEIDRYEVQQNRQVATIESVKHLLKSYKEVYLVIGADNLSSLEQWNSFKELKSLVTFIVASRDNIIIDKKFLQLKIDAQISSSELRENMKPSMLPQECAIEIEQYYKEHNAR